MPLPVGQTIKDRYRISRVISTQGGFGNTYLAYDSMRGQDIVIKESKTAADIEQDALLSELRILLSLDHARLPKVYDGFFHERQLCVTMQYIPGRDVSSYVVLSGPERRADPPDRPTALRWIAQTLEALAYLHSSGIVHRDVKPSNLRVHTETGEIFLLDFGISHHTERAVIRAHSPRFSPPEQHDPSGTTTPASDIYAVGATLYLLLTGREPPYRDDHNDMTLRLPTEENQTIPKELENIVVKAMRYNAEERYPDAHAMLEEFRRLGYAPRTANAPSAPGRPELPVSEGGEDESRSLKTMATITLPNLEQGDDRTEQPSTPASELPLNTIINDRYYIQELISKRGGFGTTYRAVIVKQSQKGSREVVIKVSKTTEDDNQNSLLAESELLSRLKHPRLPAVYGAFFYKGLLCIAMEYIRGRDVSSYLRDDPLDRRTAMQWTRQLLEALAYLHKREIVHCDVKPSNLRISAENGDLVLLDFGISQQENALVVRGYSPRYSAPEQRLRNGQITPATDVYAAGAMLYTFLTGSPPPERNGQTEPLLFLDSNHHAIPDKLKSVARKALQHEPGDRYPNAQAMLDDLQRLPYARSAPTPALLWGLVGLGVAVLVALAITVSTLASARLVASTPTGAVATESVAASFTQAPTAALAPNAPTASPESTSSPAPTLARTVIVADAAVLLAPTSRTLAPPTAPAPTAAGTPTPQTIQVRQLEVAGQLDGNAINVRNVPVRLTLVGEGLDALRSAALQPKTPGQRAIPLRIVEVRSDRAELELTALPQSFRVGEYELLINDQVSRTVALRDFVREARLQGVKPEYRYLAAIRAFPSIRFNNQEIPGPFAMLYREPEPSARGAYLQNGDRVEILDDTTSPNFYRVRVVSNFDPNVVGIEGWVAVWVVEDTPPPPPAPGAIQMPYNIRGEPRERVIEWLLQRGVAIEQISSDFQTRERIPEVFDRFQADDVVSADPPEGAWISQGGSVILGVRAP